MRKKDKQTTLRERAEQQLVAAGPRDISKMSAAEVAAAIHELETHQIELEMQNTELQEAQGALAQARDQYAELYDFAPTGYLTLDAKGLIVQANLTLENMLGISRERLIRQPLSAYIAADDQDVYFLHKRKLLETKKGEVCELRLNALSGETFWVGIDCVFDEARRQIRATVSNITKRKKSEIALRNSEAMLNETGHMAKIGGWAIDLESESLAWTQEVYAIHEVADDFQPTVEAAINFYAPEYRPVIQQAIERAIQDGESFDIELELITAQGGRIWVRAIGRAEFENDTAQTVVGTFQDVTERKLAEEDLRKSEATIRNKLKAIVEPEGDIGTLELSDIVDTDVLQSIMEDFYQLTGMLGAVLDLKGNILVAVGWQDICTKFHRCHPDTLKNCIESDTVLTKGVPEGTFKSYRCKNHMWDIVTPIMVGGRHLGNVFMGQYFLEDEVPDEELFRKQAQKYGFDEKEYLAALSRVPRFSRDAVDAGMQFYSKLAGLVSTLSFSAIQQSRLLAERKRAEEEKERIARLPAENPNAVLRVSTQGILEYANAASGAFISTLGADVGGRIHSEWQARVDEVVAAASPDNIQVNIEDRVFAVTLTPVPEHDYVNLYATDITEAIRVEEQLRQAQKMEAVGHLAGGIAHDFNNILQTISGFSELALATTDPQDAVHGQLSEIAAGAERAAVLVRQLLTFSRKQIISPEDIDLNELIANELKMLRRTLAENIEFEFIPAHQVDNFRADRGQIEQVLMNLCVNARDAMPSGGKLIIKTENVSLPGGAGSPSLQAAPGRYVHLSVTDTGFGMSNDTKEQIFEPFFTTKEVGKGTGLGLATVFGILEQNGGYVDVHSEEGKGTSFNFYFPVRDPALKETAPPVEPAVAGGTETILLAEDDVAVLTLAERVLCAAGYSVLIAQNGEDALQLFEQHADEIDMAVFDVVMPRMGGDAAMEAILKLRPGLPHCFVSGYTGGEERDGFIKEENSIVINKPYHAKELLQKIRDVLDEK